MSNSVNKVPGNNFPQGLTVQGGIVADSLTVNGVAITSGSGVTLNTDINVGTSTTAAASNITAALKSKNDSQDTNIAANTTDIASLKAGMDAVYGGTALSWVGLGAVAFASGSQFMPKSGGTFSGDVTYGTNNITAVKDVKFSNALIGTGTLSNFYGSNVYCGNVVANYHIGDGSQLTNINTAGATAFGTTAPGAISIGRGGRNITVFGQFNSDLAFLPNGLNNLTGAADVQSSNAVLANRIYSSNIYSGNVICAPGSFYYGDGSKLTGITATGSDTTSATNICTVPTSGTTLNIGTNLTSSAINIGNASNIPSVNIRGGQLTIASSGTGGSGAIKIDGSSTSIQTVTDGNVNIGKSAGTGIVSLYGSKVQTIQTPTISPTAFHSSPQTGFMQTMIIPLSGEQGPITLTSGAGILPLVMFRVPFSINIYGARMSCMQASTSGAVTVDVRLYPQSTVISGSTVNSTTGTSIFLNAGGFNIDSGLYSSYGSTAVAQNGVLAATPINATDDSIIGVFVTSTGASVLGLKLTLYYCYT